MKTHFYLLVVLNFLFTAIASASQPMSIKTGDDPPYSIKPLLSVLEDKGDIFDVQDLYKQGQDHSFVPIQDWSIPFESETTYWARMEIKNEIKNEWKYFEWVLHFPLANSHIDLYAFDKNGAVQHSKTGVFIPSYQKNFAPTVRPNLAKIIIPPGETVQIFIKIRSVRSSVFPDFDMTIQSAASYYKNLRTTKRNNGFYLGFLLMMLVYNMILFFIAKDSAYVYYSFYLLTIAAWTSLIVGDVSDLLHPILFRDHPEYVYFGKIFVYMALASYMAFIRVFLDLKILLPIWDRIFKWFSFAALPFVLLDYFLIFQSNFSPNVSDIVIILYTFIFLFISFRFIIPLYRTEDAKGYFVLGGLAGFLMGIVLTLFMRLQSLDFSIFWFKLGSSFEIIVFSLGLAYRQRENEKLKQQAEFDLKQSELIQEQEQKEADRLKELDILKNQLYANIAHEFRTPLTVIMGMSEDIVNHPKEKELILRNSKNLYQLINQMLDLAKLEAGNSKPNFVQSDIINYLKYLTESMQVIAENKSVQLHFYSEIKKLFMDFDEKGMQHIVQNLLSNAIKFTPNSGHVTLHSNQIQKEDQYFLQIKVQDSGSGIPAEEIPHIFNRFYQGKTSNASKIQGTGIGLALTKELIGIYGGSISVESEVNNGTAFTVLLPVNKNTQLVKNLAFNSDPLVLEDAPKEQTKKATFIDSKSSDLPIVLIIEDNEDVTTYIKSCLQESFKLYSAENGQIGIEQAFQMIPDIIVSDVMMPEKDGFEVVQTLKQDQRTSHIPIVLLTAKATVADKIAGLQYGADDYITKPFYKNELIARVENLIKSRQQLHDLFRKGMTQKKDIPNLQTQFAPEAAFIKKLTQVVIDELGNSDFSKSDLAKKIHLTPSQLHRKLKALTNKTTLQFIRAIRMEKALVLLQNSNQTIAEIAFQVGYNDPNYFSRAFHQEYNKTPSDIRK